MGSDRRRARDLRVPAKNDHNPSDKPRAEYSYTEFYPDFNPRKQLLELRVKNIDAATSPGKNAYIPNTGKITGHEARIVDEYGREIFINQAMASIGYQETDEFELPVEYIHSSDFSSTYVCTDDSLGPSDADRTALTSHKIQVEYDMDAHDNEFLKQLNKRRVDVLSVPEVSPEIFELTMTLLEVEWFKIEQRMPPKKKTVAVDELSDNDDEQKCCICDESECDNSNAIVFCDGCDIAVHQDCYGVPFIPEGQWLCRQCKISRRRRASCIFCPNKSGALKQTNTQHWAHVLCALFIPEVSFANEVYLEPICNLEYIPKSRWKLNCYICRQKIGACIQCSSKNCFQAFHPTCARKARLCLRMTAGVHGAVNDPGTLVSFCDKHTPTDYEEADQVAEHLKKAQRHYAELIRSGRTANSDYNTDRNIVRETKIVRVRKPGMPSWRTDQGTPAVPHITIMKITNILGRFNIVKIRTYLLEVAKYWTLKRQSRRGAALTKRLQLALEAMPNENLSKSQAQEKSNYYRRLVMDIEKLQQILNDVKNREQMKLELTATQLRIVDLVYFPVHTIILPLWAKIIKMSKKLSLLNLSVDCDVSGSSISKKIDQRQYQSVNQFINDIREYFNAIVQQYSGEFAQHKIANNILKTINASAQQLNDNYATIKMYNNGLPNYAPVKFNGLIPVTGDIPVIRRTLRKRI